MSFVLYNAPQSTCSQKVRICLWEKDLPFTEKKLDLFKGDQLTPEYRKLNPNGVVPTLVHDDETIIDSSVIIEYLDELFPEVPLSPATAAGRAHMREWLRFFEEVPTPAVRVPSYNRVFLRHFQSMTEEEFIAFGESKPLRKDFFLKMGRTGYSEEEMKQAEGRLRMSVERMEEQLQNGEPWLLGDYSLADICIMPVMMRMDDIGMDTLWADCAKVAEWFDRFREREALQKTFYFGSLLSEQYGDVKVN
jgi:glutathione S-transferase